MGCVEKKGLGIFCALCQKRADHLKGIRMSRVCNSVCVWGGGGIGLDML